MISRRNNDGRRLLRWFSASRKYIYNKLQEVLAFMVTQIKQEFTLFKQERTISILRFDLVNLFV